MKKKKKQIVRRRVRRIPGTYYPIIFRFIKRYLGEPEAPKFHNR